MLSGDNSILQRATEAKKATDEASAKEQIQMAVLGSYKTNGGLDLDELKTNLAKLGATVIGSNLPLEVKFSGQNFIIDTKGEVKESSNLDGNDSFIENDVKFNAMFHASLTKHENFHAGVVSAFGEEFDDNLADECELFLDYSTYQIRIRIETGVDTGSYPSGGTWEERWFKVYNIENEQECEDILIWEDLR